MDDTLLQFGRPAAAAGAGAEPSARARASVCPRCAHHFSPDGRFCPFDGEALQPAPDWDPGTDALIGSLVDNRYEVLSVLGEGGMGIVYEVRHRALGKRFALKALRKDLASDGEIAARFMQEARTAASVSHPGLVEITDFGSLPGGQPFFVMELLEGKSLAALIRSGGPIPAGRGVDIIRQVADALAAAHERSIIHRDLKPDNIHIALVDGRDRVTIVDFGLARVIGASRLTRAGMVFGTPHYMSPEQAMGEVTDHRADVYALGVVMYEMFTGSVPFEADSYMGVLTKHMYMAPTPPSQVAGTAKLGALEGMLLRCLEKKPDQRYASLRDLIRDLDRLISPGDTIALIPPRRGPVHSLLADELELPSREEVAQHAHDGPPMTRPGWLFSVVGTLFLAGIGAVFVARSCLTSKPQRTIPVATSSALVPTIPDNSAPVPEHAVQSAAPSASASVPPVSSTALPVSPAPARGSGSTRKPSPRRTVGVADSPKKKPAQVSGSEIVDPWAR